MARPRPAVRQAAQAGKGGTAPEASGRFFTGQKCFCHKVILYLLTKIKASLTSRPAERGMYEKLLCFDKNCGHVRQRGVNSVAFEVESFRPPLVEVERVPPR